MVGLVGIIRGEGVGVDSTLRREAVSSSRQALRTGEVMVRRARALGSQLV